jgi:predicted ArsR family transcriptional regulator
MVGKTGTLRALVLALLKQEALTDEQIATRLNLAGNTARPRRIELVTAGLVEQAGTRKTASGRTAATWTAVTPTSIGA